jgi:PEP-CTERM motif
VTFTDYPVPTDAGKYFNNIYHAYGATDPVQVFAGLSGSAAAVPEPGTAVLAAIGMLIGLVPAVRRYRRGN